MAFLPPFLIFLDMETDGLDSKKCHPLHIAFDIVEEITGRDVCSYSQYIALPSTTKNQRTWEREHAPALAINNITWESLQTEGRPVDTVASDIMKLIRDLNTHRQKIKFYCQNPIMDRAFFLQHIITNPNEQEALPYHWFDLMSAFHALGQRAQTDYWQKSWVSRMLMTEPSPSRYFSLDSISLSCGLLPEPRPHTAVTGVQQLKKCYECIVGFPQPQL